MPIMDIITLAIRPMRAYTQEMKNMNERNDINGHEIRKAVKKSGFSKEQVVASVQDLGYSFSLAGLDRMYRGEFPVNDCKEIIEAIALKCRCQISDFAESEIKTA